METGNRANGSVRMAESTVHEAYGASQIGPFDYCPKLGFREYWYPGIEARQVRGKPVHMQMLGDDLVLFELPSKIRVMIGASIHLRWMVPVTEHDTRVWTFTLVRKPRTALHAAWQWLWYHGYRKPSIIIATNEKEDLVIFKRERINLERPQKLGPLDVGLIYFRRHLAKRARDYQRKPEGAVTASVEASAGNRSRSSRAPSESRE